MDVIGKIKMIGPIMQVSASFKKRELVVTTDEQYPQHIQIEFSQDKVDLLNNFHLHQPVKVSINLRGREWISPQGEAKYFNQIQGWRIEAQNAPAGPPPANTATTQTNPQQSYTAMPYDPNDDQDDLPF
jgi:hypothetical protein